MSIVKNKPTFTFIDPVKGIEITLTPTDSEGVEVTHTQTSATGVEYKYTLEFGVRRFIEVLEKGLGKDD